MAVMQLLNTSSQYGAVSRSIHWTTAVLVILLLVSGKAGEIEPESSNALYYWHSSLGLLVLLMVVARIAWRLVTPAPQLPATMSGASARIARGLHTAFYVLLLALPVSGWLTASAEGGPVTFFGMAVPPWQASPASSEEVHEVLGNVLIILIVLHALAALKHHFVDKDGVLRRMLPTTSRPPG
jgi:cytochrome b561